MSLTLIQAGSFNGTQITFSSGPFAGHVEEADDPYADPAAGDVGSPTAEGVEGIAVLAHRALDEPVVGGVAHGREQPPVEDDLTELGIELVLVPRAGGHLDEDDDIGNI